MRLRGRAPRRPCSPPYTPPYITALHNKVFKCIIFTMSQTTLLILSISLIFTAIVEVGLAIVVIALYQRVENSSRIMARIDVLEESYNKLRAAKANAARQPTKFPASTSGYPAIDQALADLSAEERSLFQ